MKKVFSFLVLCTITLSAQVISLPSKWLFKTGDNSSYKEIGLDDKSWAEIEVPSWWENQGHPNYDGFAWYRLHFKIEKKNLTKEYYLLPGKIDDIDETYLNGELIGSLGKFPPDIQSECNAQRIYKIPKNLLKEENVLAVRVFDVTGGGGIWGGLIGLYEKKYSEKILALGPAPKKSFFQLVTSNGLIAAVYNEQSNLIETVSPHIFQMYDLNKPVRPFIKNLRIEGYERGNKVTYLNNSHIIKVQNKNFTVYYLAPFTTEQKIFYAVIEGKKNLIEKLNFTYEKDKAEVLKEEVMIEKENGVAEKYFLFSFNDSLHNNTEAMERYSTKEPPINLLENELHFMKSVFKRAYFPKNISAAEKKLYEQSIAILKMGQVSQKEIFEKSRGQIIASLPPGNWNIGWLRDGCYAIQALSQLGLYEEAKNALNFFLKADAGYYKSFVWKDGIDYGVKSDYKLSVCRYFGIGKEESDFNENGPNVELDGFGLFLTAFSDYINKSKDIQFLQQNYSVLTKQIADPIISFVDSNNIIRKESGPWEMHLPGRQNAFTSIVNSAGLKNLAALLKENNYSDFEKYFSAADRLADGIKKQFFYGGKSIKGFAEAATPQTLDFYDGGTVEAFTQNVINDKNFFQSYFSDYEKGLRINKRRGFSRLNDPDWYTIGEWPFLNLRYAIALKNYGFKEKAKKLIDWTTTYSKLNFNFIAEVYGYRTESYEGAVPMVGYGAGAYILTINNYYEK